MVNIGLQTQPWKFVQALPTRKMFGIGKIAAFMLKETYRSVLTRTQIKSEIYSDLEIGDNVNVDDKQGTKVILSTKFKTVNNLN